MRGVGMSRFSIEEALMWAGRAIFASAPPGA